MGASTVRSHIMWANVVLFAMYHVFGCYGLYFFLTWQVKWKTFVWALFLIFLSGQGITAGVHRLWSHRSYKATLPLRILLCICQTIAFQNDIFEWARDHRVHHKFTDTNADPYNSTRGFFFSHMGWLLVRKHPDVVSKGKTVDVSDLEADPVVIFQRKYYLFLAPLLSFVVPAMVPVWYWNEGVFVAWSFAAILRYLYTLHGTWLVNSAAHMWGMRPYDRDIRPVENPFVSHVTMGEGWHNYHHVFPWDYKAAELPTYYGNLSTAFIDFMGKIGWAYDMKTANEEMVRKRQQRTGATSQC